MKFWSASECLGRKVVLLFSPLLGSLERSSMLGGRFGSLKEGLNETGMTFVAIFANCEILSF